MTPNHLSLTGPAPGLTPRAHRMSKQEKGDCHPPPNVCCPGQHLNPRVRVWGATATRPHTRKVKTAFLSSAQPPPWGPTLSRLSRPAGPLREDQEDAQGNPAQQQGARLTALPPSPQGRASFPRTMSLPLPPPGLRQNAGGFDQRLQFSRRASASLSEASVVHSSWPCACNSSHPAFEFFFPLHPPSNSPIHPIVCSLKRALTQLSAGKVAADKPGQVW